MNLIYYIFLLLIIFLLLKTIIKNEKVSPKKIKIYMSVVIILFLLRYIGLFILSIVKGGILVYFFKNIIYLNYLAIPLIVIALVYVYLRWDKVGFNNIYIFASLLSLIYIFGMISVKGKVIFDVDYGYLITMKSEVNLFLGELIILGILLVFSIYHLDKPNNNKLGMYYLISGIIIVIVENILFLGGKSLFPYPIISDSVFLILINLGLNTFKVK